MPLVESSEDASDRRRALYVLDVASGELTVASPFELNVWEAAWCGDGAVVAIVSEGAGESAWYRAELALIDPRRAQRAHAARAATSSSAGSAAPAAGRTQPWSRPSAAIARSWPAICSLIDPASGRGPQRRHPRRGRHLDGLARRRAPARTRRARPRAGRARRRTPRRGTAAEIWVGAGRLRRQPLSVRIADRAAAAPSRRCSRPGIARRRSHVDRRRGGADAGRPRPCRARATGRELIADRRRVRWTRARRARDRRLPHAAARRGAVPDHPARARRPDLGLPGPPAARRSLWR